ncbi:hypothetical protein HDU91_003659 [Kappamyces sp. JEL0680]|nr:hypothetical protein HDU91_003659 [Kappamyces sp. JEL0680]
MKINSTLLLSVAAAACPAGFIPANALACDITTGILYNKGDCTPASSTTNYYVTDFPNSPCQVLPHCTVHAGPVVPAAVPDPDVAAGHRETVAPVVPTAGKKSNLKRRLKRMLNPFLVQDVSPELLPNWEQVFDDVSRPLCLDIGCAKGGYIERLRTSVNDVAADPDDAWKGQRWNFCGVELYAPLVAAALQLEASRNRAAKDLHYVHANINRSLETLRFPNLQRITFLFADPWACGPTANSKNKKRRVMSRSFAVRLAALLPCGGDIYFASDWHELAVDIRESLLSTGCFDLPQAEGDAETSIARPVCPWPCVPTHTASQLAQLQPLRKDRTLIDTEKDYEKPVVDHDSQSKWLFGLPFGGIQTERDLVCENQWRRVYRLVLVRNSAPARM